MNDFTECELKAAIQRLRPSLPRPRAVPFTALLRVAAGEISVTLLLLVLVVALAFGYVSARLFSIPMTTIFCTSPMPLLLLFHQYILREDHGMLELEATLRYSYDEMLLARASLISCYMCVLLPVLAIVQMPSTGGVFLRLTLCGAVPCVYLCALLLYLSGRGLVRERTAVTAAVIWAALSFLSLVSPLDRLLENCSTAGYFGLLLAGAWLCARILRQVKIGRCLYVGGR